VLGEAPAAAVAAEYAGVDLARAIRRAGGAVVLEEDVLGGTDDVRRATVREPGSSSETPQPQN
jgi:hypothetical protein